MKTVQLIKNVRKPNKKRAENCNLDTENVRTSVTSSEVTVEPFSLRESDDTVSSVLAACNASSALTKSSLVTPFTPNSLQTASQRQQWHVQLFKKKRFTWLEFDIIT